MMRSVLFVLFLGLLAVPVVAWAGDGAPAAKPTIVTGFTDLQLEALLKKNGFTATKLKDRLLSLTVGLDPQSDDGLKALCLISEDRTDLQFVAMFKGDDVTLSMLNAWNRDKRFSRAYLDSDQDVVLASDLEVGKGVTEASVAHWFEICRISLLTFQAHLLELTGRK